MSVCVFDFGSGYWAFFPNSFIVFPKLNPKPSSLHFLGQFCHYSPLEGSFIKQNDWIQEGGELDH